ncbi:MAG TPA: bacterioferritin, partial [Syntrophaceticus sp.]|nr:bacterioferritin [Syntrophaceticus sp.]
AETIYQLGVDPRYRIIEKDNAEKYWDSSFVFYGTALCDRLTADLAGEWAAIANYRRHQNMIKDPYVKRILERIILDELHHVVLFNQVIEKYCQPRIPKY